MGALVATLLIAAAAFAIWAVQTIVGKSVSTVDRAVRCKTLHAGRAEATTRLSIVAPVAPKDLLPRIVSVVNPFDSPPALVGGLYLKQQTGTLAQFAFGSKANGDAFGAAVRLTPRPDGCDGSYEILHWSESGADVQGKREMERLRSRVEQAVLAASGRVRESGS